MLVIIKKVVRVALRCESNFQFDIAVGNGLGNNIFIMTINPDKTNSFKAKKCSETDRKTTGCDRVFWLSIEEWAIEKRKRIAELKATGEYNIVGQKVYGICCDCNHYRLLKPDHKIKRSQGGKHDKENLDWVCKKCHDKRDNQGDPMKKKPKSKKADWQRPHKCASCKQVTSMLICPNCNKLSIKQ